MTVYRRPDPIPLRRSSASPAATAIGVVRTEPDDLNRVVAREIFHAIVSGRFAVGSILPNEHQLASDLGVSRTALREAIKGLVSKGLVETRRKRGTLVLDRSHWNMLDAEVIAWSRRAGSARVSEELWGAIALTQPALAEAAAAQRRSGRLADAIAALDGAVDTDTRRHAFGAVLLEIARASDNRFLASLVESSLGNLLADDPAALDRVMAGLDLAALHSLPGLIVAGDIAGAGALLRRLLSARELVG